MGGQTWEVPQYYASASSGFGGSATHWPSSNTNHPTDHRRHLSFWGSDESNSYGGCCKADYASDNAAWNQAFTMSTCTPEYDCSAGIERWEKAWSRNKKAWCCHITGDGCEFNCDAGYDVWEYDWSDAKKTWCCHSEGKGCTTTTAAPTPGPTPDPYAAIFQKLLEKLEVNKGKLSNLETMHQTTTTTTTVVSQICSAKKDKHARWCMQVCNNPRKACKRLCSERCQGGCQCKNTRGGLTR